MIVVIAIIVILTAITVSATVAINRKSEVRVTENTIKLLDLALSQWESVSDRAIRWGDPANPPPQTPNVNYEYKDGTPHVFNITEVLQVIRRQPEAQSILSQINADYVFTYDSSDDNAPAWLPTNVDPTDPDPNAGAARGQYDSGDWDGGITVLDAWGKPIRAVHPGRVADPIAFPIDTSAEIDADGTVHVNDIVSASHQEEIYGPAVSRRIYFVSAGPDGRFGNLSAAEDTDEHEQAHDNLYSYPVEDDH